MSDTRILELYRERCAQLEDLEQRVAAHDYRTDPEVAIKEIALLDYLRNNCRKLSQMARAVHSAQAIASKG